MKLRKRHAQHYKPKERHKTGGRLLSLLLSVCLLCTMLPSFPVKVFAEAGTPYRDYNDVTGQFEDKTVENATSVVKNMTTLGTDGADTWYVVDRYSTVTVSSRIQTKGNVHLILASGSTLKAEKGTEVLEDASLTIYDDTTYESSRGKISAGIYIVLRRMCRYWWKKE